MLPLLAAVLLTLVLPRLAAAQASAENRLALVIGNAAYRNSPLLNPVNDARLMESALREAGFTVIKAENASLREMRRLLRDFGDRLKQNGGVGLFYFAGHGLQVRGENYLVSVDSDIRNEDEVADDALNAQLVLEKMQSAGNRVNVVILDACRNNPFAVRSRSSVLGLATMHAPSGSIIAYSTAPGSVASDGGGQNGLYTQHLARVIPQAGVPIEEAFKMVRAAVRRESNNQQVPWENTALEGQFFFKPAAGQVVASLARPDPLPLPVAAGPSEREKAYWENVKNSGSVQELQSYLDRYPNGEYAAIARSRIANVSRPPAVEAPALSARPAPPSGATSAAVPAAAPAAPAQSGEFTAGTTKFIGKFAQDIGSATWSGEGKVIWANGDVFEGTLDKGRREGMGRFSWANGQHYEGTWQNDRPQGSGKIRFPDGNQYEGEVADGFPQGQGQMAYASGDSYVGQFGQGLPNGRGVYTWKSGQRFEGEWQRGSPQGSGIMKFANGNLYEGGIADGVPHGAGRMVYASGDTYTGTFRVGVPDGNGAFVWKNGDQYTGQWKAGNKDGTGVFVWSNGDRWEGVFSNDRQTEQGTLTRKQ